MPYGFGGVVEGAAVVFFAVFGYDTLTTAAEEARDPQRQLPRAVLLSLAVSLTLYIAMSLVLTGIVRYDTLNNAGSGCDRLHCDRLALGDASRFGRGRGGHRQRHARFHAGLRPHLVRHEPGRIAARMVRASASTIPHAPSPDADRWGADSPRRGLLPHQGGRRTW